MNIAAQALVTAWPEGASRRGGHSSAIVAAGSMAGLTVGAVLAGRFGPHIVFLGADPPTDQRHRSSA